MLGPMRGPPRWRRAPAVGSPRAASGCPSSPSTPSAFFRPSVAQEDAAFHAVVRAALPASGELSACGTATIGRMQVLDATRRPAEVLSAAGAALRAAAAAIGGEATTPPYPNVLFT